ncbi:PREDICTED: probable polyamine transporter At1g31830 [Tarenaya hassleriana]|uniref:probable polyamine transporter At1g31830 n=1 Tax=Tarenaya hassleriana TaxID=28532 RepID=UPI00053C6120|nr:PREDICTED: probable polyamine transporter At1g31830 [Tarenaya hassleriana]
MVEIHGSSGEGHAAADQATLTPPPERVDNGQKLTSAVAGKPPESLKTGRYNGVEHVNVAADGFSGGYVPPHKSDKSRKISVLPLVFLIFYQVSGGAFGAEDSVKAAGPLLAILGFLIFPFMWCVPEALITAEMGTMFNANGGYVVWVSSALGPLWGFQLGWMKWLSGVMDNALYPVLFLDYFKSEIPSLSGGWPRTMAVLALTLMLTYLNYRGLAIVGSATVLLGILSLLPFLLMGLISIPKLNPSRWLVVDIRHVDWNLYLNTLFWNLNHWDSISTLAGEVENPSKTLPRSLFYALILVIASYIFPLLTGTGAVPLDRELWTDGYLAEVAKILGGTWLRWWVEVAAATSNMGMFLAEMSSDSFQLLGMAETGMIPEFFGRRSRHGTPLMGNMLSASGVILLSWLSFQEIVAVENLLYSSGMILEFIAFVRMRKKYPNASRPYKIPVGTVGSVGICVLPTVLIITVTVSSSLKVAGVSVGIVVMGLVMKPCLELAEKKRWLKFSVVSDLPDFSVDVV